MEISQLLSYIEQDEGQEVEFKTSFAEENEAIKSLCAFANAGGGHVLFGVENNGNIVGVTLGKNTLENFANKLQSNTQPPLQPTIEQCNVEGKTVVIASVQKADEGTIHWAFNSAYIRVGKTDQVLSPEDIRKRYYKAFQTKNAKTKKADSSSKNSPVRNKRSQKQENIAKDNDWIDDNGSTEKISSIFFYERVCDAFPGIRDLHIIDSPIEAVSRLCVLLRYPLQLEDRCAIWMFFRLGEININKCEAIDSTHILIGNHEINASKLAIYRPSDYKQYFIYLECAPDKPTGVYPHITEDYITQAAKDRGGRYWEEYAIWEDKLLTMEEYADYAVFQNGQSIPTIGAQAHFRHLTRDNIIIAPFHSNINNSTFDSQRAQWLDQLLNDQMSLSKFIEIIEQLPIDPRKLL